MSFRALAACLAVLSGFPTLATAQNVSIDEGAFRIYLDGQAAGREEFSIRRSGVGDQARVILRGTVTLTMDGGDLNLAPAMDAQGTSLITSAYQIKVSGIESTDIFVNLSERRYLARVISARGEELREFRAGPGSVLLDQDIAHHHHLLSPFLDETSAVSLTVLEPRARRQFRATLTALGEEEIRVGGGLIQARHFRLQGSEASRDLWFDAQGRVMRVEIPSRNYIAERESLS
jgi:hypothetical protein